MDLGISEIQSIFGLNPRQASFCLEYLDDLDATAAYRRAGYKPRTNNAAYASASQLLSHPKVQAAVELLKARRSQRLEVDSDRVLEEIKAIAFAKLGDVIEWGDDGIRFKESTTLEPAVMAAVDTVGGKTPIKLHSKLKALELLCRHVGIAPERVEHSISESLSDALDTLSKAGID